MFESHKDSILRSEKKITEKTKNIRIVLLKICKISFLENVRENEKKLTFVSSEIIHFEKGAEKSGS